MTADVARESSEHHPEPCGEYDGVSRASALRALLAADGHESAWHRVLRWLRWRTA